MRLATRKRIGIHRSGRRHADVPVALRARASPARWSCVPGLSTSMPARCKRQRVRDSACRRRACQELRDCPGSRPERAGWSRCRAAACATAPRPAWRWPPRACRPCAMSLASIGSYQVVTSVPVSIQVSTRTSSGNSHLGQQAAAGPEVARRILGIDARLHRMAARYVAGGPARSGGAPAATRIIHSTRSTPTDFLGDAVLHLQSRVHLEEVELAARPRRRRIPPCRRSGSAPPCPGARPRHAAARAGRRSARAPASPR